MRRATSERIKLFQFTPLREGRLADAFFLRNSTNFNSRPSARGDRYANGQGSPTVISIHAPPRGATAALARRQRISETYFNSRPSARGDGSSVLLMDSEKQFQFTPLREGRRAFDAVYNPITHFNSRPSARGDVRCKMCCMIPADFNSRPSARGDRHHIPLMRLRLEFQFTPLREGRRAIIYP